MEEDVCQRCKRLILLLEEIWRSIPGFRRNVGMEVWRTASGRDGNFGKQSSNVGGYDRNMDEWMGKEGTTCRVIYLRVVVVRRKRRKTNIHVCTFRYQKISISFETANGELDFLFSKEDDENSWLS